MSTTVLENKPKKNIHLRSIGIYTITNFFSKGVSFLLIPLFTNPAFLTPADNGVLNLFSQSILFLMPLVCLGTLQSTSTDYFKLNKNDFRDSFTTGLLLPLIVTFLLIIILFVFKNDLYNKFGVPESLIWLLPLITFLFFCNEQLIILIRNNDKPLQFFYVNALRVCLELGIALILIVFLHKGWAGRISGIIISYLVITLAAFYYFIKKGYLFGSVKMNYIRSELIYALPIISLQGSVFFMYSSDRFFISNILKDKSIVGIYGIAATVASVIFVFGNALQQYIFPKIYNALAAKEGGDFTVIKKEIQHFIFYMLAGTIALLIFTPLAYKYFINEKYKSALDYIFYLIAGNFLFSTAYVFNCFLLYKKEKRKILFLSLISIIIAITNNFYFIHQFKEKGAAIAMCITCSGVLIITLLVTWKDSKRIFIKPI